MRRAVHPLRFRHVHGVVQSFSTITGYGFIDTEHGNVFVHKNNILIDPPTLRPNQRVTFDIYDGSRGLQAANVVLTDSSSDDTAPQLSRPTTRRTGVRRASSEASKRNEEKDETREDDASGIDPDRCEDHVHEELVCSICQGVLNSPVQTPCEHLFCRYCISKWLKEEQFCPNDRKPVTQRDLREAPCYLRSLLAHMRVRCRYTDLGCRSVVRVEQLATHERDCPNKNGESDAAQQTASSVPDTARLGGASSDNSASTAAPASPLLMRDTRSQAITSSKGSRTSVSKSTSTPVPRTKSRSTSTPTRELISTSTSTPTSVQQSTSTQSAQLKSISISTSTTHSRSSSEVEALSKSTSTLTLKSHRSKSTSTSLLKTASKSTITSVLNTTSRSTSTSVIKAISRSTSTSVPLTKSTSTSPTQSRSPSPSRSADAQSSPVSEPASPALPSGSQASYGSSPTGTYVPYSTSKKAKSKTRKGRKYATRNKTYSMETALCAPEARCSCNPVMISLPSPRVLTIAVRENRRHWRTVLSETSITDCLVCIQFLILYVLLLDYLLFLQFLLYM